MHVVLISNMNKLNIYRINCNVAELVMQTCITVEMTYQLCILSSHTNIYTK